ncbi:glutamic acid-rich protein-like isoform X3 [Phycodurus eques]|uniref:glutamic acid-rich protein-like isoform X3 n=1 Tax=Phycodurus eques TaxID=693459 RepID=UPI002ACE4AB1|nr:glutamic acid-rich protein-like isoform X3 [Phycodurus eques]
MCARTTAKDEKELCGPKEEDEPRRQLVDAVREQPRVGFPTADISENLHPERQQSVSTHIKEEEEDEEVQHIKEEEQEEIIKVPSTGVPLKGEDGQSEERRGAEPQSSSSSQQMTEGDGDRCGGSQADGDDEEDDEDDDDEQSEGECDIMSSLSDRGAKRPSACDPPLWSPSPSVLMC